MFFEPQCDRARHKCDSSKMLAQTVMQFLTEPALFAVTDGEDFAFQSASAVFQDGLSFFLVADVDNNRDRRLGFAFGVAQWRRAHTDPQERPFLATITFLQFAQCIFRAFPRGDVVQAINRSDYFSLRVSQGRRANQDVLPSAARSLDYHFQISRR